VDQARSLLDRRWPQLLAGGLALIGVGVIALGAVGLATTVTVKPA